jgi:hypothetical protein
MSWLAPGAVSTVSLISPVPNVDVPVNTPLT